MMDSSEKSVTKANTEKSLKVKRETIEEQVEELILPDLSEPSAHVKSEKRQYNTNCSNNQGISNIKINNSNVLLNKTLININGVFYLLERIPEASVQKEQTENTVSHVEKTAFVTSESAQCPKCGKILQQRRNLKRHMKMCYNNSSTFQCRKCNYQTKSGHYWLVHGKECGKTKPKKRKEMKTKKQRISRKVNCFCICLTCNTSTLLYAEKCSKCGSRNHWKCKICNAIFQMWERARSHLRTKCKPESYYHCLICDYKHVVKYHAHRHIRRSHPECKPTLDFCEPRKVLTDANTVEHVCSLCQKKYDDAPGLNRHTYMCNKYQLYSRGVCEKIKTNVDVPQTDSSSKLKHKSFRHLMFRHCKTCNEDFDLEDIGVTLTKSCIKCSSTLRYKCKKCDSLLTSYDSLVRHMKATCNQEDQFKCNQCDFVTNSMSHLTEHNKRHGDISATCTNCGLLFTNSNYFKRHLKKCGLTTIFQCGTCPYKTKIKRYLRNHIISSHNATLPASFNSINKLDSSYAKNLPHIQPYCTNCCRHQTTNYQLKTCKLCNSKLQFNCSTCNKMHSTDDSDVCKHVKNYLELLSFKCKRCGKDFSSKDGYKLHENQCGRTKRYRCTLCSYSTQYETYFRLHGRHAHQIRYIGRRCLNEKDSKPIEMMNALYQKSTKETSNNTFDRDSKLNMQCKVVLTRLDIKTI